jgi:hypothetical protein
VEELKLSYSSKYTSQTPSCPKLLTSDRRWDSAWRLSTGRSLWIDDRPRKQPIYPSLPLDNQNLAIVKRLPVGFHDLCTRGLVSTELLRVLSRMKTAMSFKSPKNIPYDQKVGSYDDYLSVSSFAVLLDADNRPREPSQMLEALLSLGLILFSSTAFNEMRATPVLFRGPKDALYRHLLRTTSEASNFSDDAHSQCYQWVWAVTVDAWRDASRELMPQGRHLLNEFHDRYASKWKNSENLVSMLKRFFWTEDLVMFHRQSFEAFRATYPKDSSSIPT